MNNAHTFAKQNLYRKKIMPNSIYVSFLQDVSSRILEEIIEERPELKGLITLDEVLEEKKVLRDIPCVAKCVGGDYDYLIVTELFLAEVCLTGGQITDINIRVHGDGGYEKPVELGSVHALLNGKKEKYVLDLFHSACGNVSFVKQMTAPGNE